MHSIDIYKVINGLYFTETLITSLQISDINQTTELDEFCQLFNCHIAESNADCLLCNYTKVVKFYIK